MAIWRGAGGPGDATTDAANEASVASTKAAEAEASATAAASSATSASNSATTAINSKDAAATSESNASTSALTATTQASNASTSASAADTSATAAQTAQTAAEAAKTAAETAETGAEVAQTAAETAQTAAELAQTEAETSETNAETAQAAAESALASTLSTLDEFDDTYLGAKSADPTVNNDNDPLTTGALYFNTTSNDMKVYNGSAWEVTFATLSGALVAANNLSDVVDADAAKTNLGLGTTDSPTFAGLTATGNITVSGTVDGRDIATDGTKLDGIEASADVTDATNVTAAGAVMDSELTSEASVKALDQGVATTDSPSFAGLTTTNNINFGDNDKAVFGAGNDLQIYHDGYNSIVRDAGTGNLKLQAGNLEVTNGDGTQSIITGVVGGAVRVYHNNSEKLATTTTGVDVTGTVVSDGLTVASSDTYAINVTRPTAGNTTLRITSGSTAGNDAIFRADIGNTTGTSGVYFGDTATNGIGRIMYEHNGDYMRFYTVSAERMRIDSSGNVGIGTSTPGFTLDVATAGDAEIRLRTTGTGSSDHTIFRNSIGGTTGSNYIFFGDNDDSDVGQIRYDHSTNSMSFRTNTSIAVYIDSSGDVGIGTTSPAEPLDVVGTIGSNVSSTGDFNFKATSTGGGQYRIYPDDATTANPTWLHQTNSSEDQAFVIGGVERVRINSSGNVGIGTTSPANKLEVTGAIVAQGAATAYTNTGLYLQNKGSSVFDVGAWRSGASVADLTFSNDSGSDAAPVERMRIKSGGRVGIGTTAPQALVHAQGASGSISSIHVSNPDVDLRMTAYTDSYGEVRVQSNHPLVFKTNGNNEHMRIDTTGNVGIGTSSPSRNLHVSSTGSPTFRIQDADGSDYYAEIQQATGNTIFSSRFGALNGAFVFRGLGGGTADEHMRIDTTGNVGIGTTSPNAQLDVVGTVRLTNTANASNNSNLRDGGGLVVEAGNNNPLYFYTGGSEKVRINSSGNVGIGTGSPSGMLHLSGALPRIYFTDTDTSTVASFSGENGWLTFNAALSRITFNIAGSEGMRLNSNGDLLFNTTVTGVQDANAVATDSSLGRLHLNTISTQGLLYLNQSYNDNASRYQILFYRREALVGSIQSSTSATSYNTTSDYRLKENLNAISNGIDRVKQLNPLRFNFIANPEETVDGFLAHEVDSIVPEAITGEKDALDEKGNIDSQQIDQSKLVPLLTAALKESIAKIEALETRVATLENN